MLRMIILVLFLALLNVVVGDDLQSECEPRFGSSGPDFPCDGHLSTDFKCNNTFLNIADTPFYDCSNVTLFWNYPMHNLTIIIEAANHTNLKQPFTVSLTNTFGLPAYRIYPNGQQVSISNKAGKKDVQISDENYQIVVKIQAQDRLSLYGAFIEYEVAPVYTSVS